MAWCSRALLLRLVLAMLLLLPLVLLFSSNSKCYNPVWDTPESEFHASASSQDYFLGTNTRTPTSPILGYALNACGAAWLLGLVTIKRARFDFEVRAHRLAYMYVLLAITQAVSYFGNPLLLWLCPSSLAAMYSAVSGLNALLFVTSVIALLAVAQERLRMVCAEDAERRSKKLLPLFFASSAVVVGSTIARNLTHSQIARYVMIAAIVVLCMLYLVFQVNAYFGLRRAAWEGMAEASLSMGDAAFEKYKEATDVALFLALAATTSIFLGICYGVRHLHPVMSYIMQAAYMLDYWSNTILAMLAADVIKFRKSATKMSGLLSDIGSYVIKKREREIREKLVASITEASGPALAVAALLEQMEIDELMTTAMERFRAVSWQTVYDNAETITKGGLLSAVGAGSAVLHTLSVLCHLSCCDVFLSHSWSDDGEQKMEVLKDWAEDFEKKHEQEPTMWVDKFCLDQTSITEDLRCLPVFLAGCNNLLVVAGPTYASRLWCALELFVYFAMTNVQTDATSSFAMRASQDDSRCAPTVLIIGKGDDAKARIRSCWLGFDVTFCKCYHADDRERIIKVIGQFPGDTFGFNDYIRTLAFKVLPQVEATKALDDGSIRVLTEDLRMGNLLHQWNEQQWEEVIAGQASI